jgi:pyruvate kinase
MQNLSHTKIVATIGPSTWDEKVLHEMISSGLSMARINASFADFKELQEVSTKIRKLSARVALMLDTMGHKIRATGFEEQMKLVKGREVVIIPDSGTKTASDTFAVTYPNLHKLLQGGEKILIDDGSIELQVKEIFNKEIVCTVITGGVVKKMKTVNIPGIHLEFPALSEKDKEDIKFAVENNFDYISASFIRNINDVVAVREVMGKTDTKLIAKIENAEGVENFDNILGLVDGIMIARGDLGVETSLEKVPVLQKQFILKCRQAGKLSIVATQMLDSMRESPRPTRAEVSDIANAVMDGADALMLSAETSVGKYPVECVKQMNIIACEAERVLKPQPVIGDTRASEDTDILCRHVFNLVNDLHLKGVIVLSKTGKTVESLARHRMNVPIWNVSPNPQLIRQYGVFRGVHGIYIRDFKSDRDETTMAAVEVVYAQGNLELHDKIAIISGSSITNKDTNSIVEISTVKDILNK